MDAGGAWARNWRSFISVPNAASANDAYGAVENDGGCEKTWHDEIHLPNMRRQNHLHTPEALARSSATSGVAAFGWFGSAWW